MARYARAKCNVDDNTVTLTGKLGKSDVERAESFGWKLIP